MSKNVKDLSVLMRVPYQLSSQAQLSSVEPFFNRPGYEVSGWVDAMGKKYETDYRFENFKEKNVALSAEWELLRYGITYQLNGHGEAPEKSEYTVLEEYTPPDLTATGWSFQGWQPPKIDVGTTGNKTFTAGWLGFITASLASGSSNVITCTVSTPTSGAKVYYRTAADGAWTETASKTFAASGTCTVYFRIEADGYISKGQDNSFGYNITKTETSTKKTSSWTSSYQEAYNIAVALRLYPPDHIEGTYDATFGALYRVFWYETTVTWSGSQFGS